MKSTKITLWQDEREYAALQAALARNEASVESVMQEYLARLYCQVVSLEEQERIGGEIQVEAASEAPQCDDSQPVSVFHIKEHGQEYWLRQRERTEFFHAADLLRKYLSTDPQTRAASFAESLTSVDSITPREFRQLALERMENIGRVTGAFDVDFDKGEFSALHIMDGWMAYYIEDVSDAACEATQNFPYLESERWELFRCQLESEDLTDDGPVPMEVQGSRRLLPDDIRLDEDIQQMYEWLVFHLTDHFPADEVLGTHVGTGANGNYVSAYVRYDMTSGKVDGDMEVYLCRGDGVEVPLKYKLDGDERAALLDKMREYCQQQTGQSLKEYAASVQMDDPAGPRMRM